ncbi:MAG: dipeptidase, partial [Verrucomicrobiales bacterium]
EASAGRGGGGGGGPVAALTENLNPAIREFRGEALKILKPSPADLERGLQLHADALVFDTYGFSPRAAVDGDALAEAVKAGASDIELKDLREEMGMTRIVTDSAERAEYQAAWRASGVTCVFQNAGEEGQDPQRLLKRLARFTYVTDMMREFVSKAATPRDIEEAKKAGRHCLYFTGNGVPLTQAWVSVEDELRYLRVFYQLGIRMMHLTYQRRNMIGDGSGEPGNAGLSDFGRAVIAEMNRVGVIPDCAHSGWRTSLEAAQVSEKPVVGSHTVCAGLSENPHVRSKPDEVIKAIADTDGMVGICCIPRFLQRSGDINALLDHIDYVAKKFGVDYVGIGTDVAYSSRNSPLERRKVPRGPGKRRAEFRSLWPERKYEESLEMIRSIAWTNWPLFTVGLVQRGYSEDDIRKIIGGNMMRVAKASMVD